MTLLPRVDELSCCGHGDCAAIAPGVFRADEVAVVIGDGPDDLVPKPLARARRWRSRWSTPTRERSSKVRATCTGARVET